MLTPHRHLLATALIAATALASCNTSGQPSSSQPALADSLTTSSGYFAAVWADSCAMQGATVTLIDHTPVLNLGATDGYYDLSPLAGQFIAQLRDFTISASFRVDTLHAFEGYGHFLFAFSALAENAQDEGPYVAFRLNEQRFETSTGGWAHEQAVMVGSPARHDVWTHVLFRQQGQLGQLFIDGQLVGSNDQMPILAEIFSEAPRHCWIGKAPFRGDRYLGHTQVAQFRIYDHAVTDSELHELHQACQAHGSQSR